MAESFRHFDIVIVGGGFAGVYCAKRLVKRLGHLDVSIALISEENHMVFQPMLPEVVGGSLSPQDVVNPIRQLVPGVDVLKGRVTLLELEKKVMHVDGGRYAPDLRVGYKELVLTPGADVDLRRFPGMSEHAYLMRNCGDAMKLRAAVISRMEEANLLDDAEARRRLLSFVVVGGGYSGVETAGQIADLLSSICKMYEFIRPEEPEVVLIHSRDRLLPTLDSKLAEYTRRQLEKMGVKVLLNTRVQTVTATSVMLSDGERMAASTVVCTVGNAPSPLIAQLGESGALPAEKGRVLVESTGRVKGHPQLWAAGDCSVFPRKNGEICPDTAQFAMRQGIHVGENLAAARFGQPLEDFTFGGLGELASLGHRKAVAQIMGMNFSGLIAWFLWRSIYLMKLPGLDRKLRVMTEWTFELFFPRDINLLTPVYSSPVQEMRLAQGDVLFHAGEPAYSLYAVKEGCVRILDAEGRLVKRAGPGDHFGERALLGDKIWRFTAVAEDPTTLVAVGARTFETLVGSISQLNSLFEHTADAYQLPEELRQAAAELPQSLREKTAAEVMTREVASVRPDDTVAEALELFQKVHHSAYPVVGEDGRVVGLLRRSRLYEWMQDHGLETTARVADLPLTQVPRIPAARRVPEVLEDLVRASCAKAVVVDDTGVMQGMLTLYDLLRPQVKPVAA
ncbi:MAG: FAD-dependent oxidoreductase [Verrucomicrobiales bacterium]|nr:FAD-dependent oxidoreductase [Verrucomicrobiales bacterium]